MTNKEVAVLHNRMASFYAAVEAGYKKGLNDSETRKTMDMDDWKNLKGFDALMGGNINSAYLEVEAANF